MKIVYLLDMNIKKILVELEVVRYSWSNFKFKEFKYDDIVLEKPVEAEAYKALSLSSLKNKIELNPRNILILKDEYSVFDNECVNVTIDNNGDLTAKKETTTIKNNIWDGEGLLDKSVFDKNGYSEKGMLFIAKFLLGHLALHIR